MSHGAFLTPHRKIKSSSMTDLEIETMEKEMATHSSILAWRIPGMEEPVGYHLWGRTESDTTDVT